MDSQLLSSPSSRFPLSLLGAAVCGGGWDLAAPERGAPWKGACRNLPPREAQRLYPSWFLPGREAETGQAERCLFLLPSTGVVSGLGGSSRRFQEKCPAGLAPHRPPLRAPWPLSKQDACLPGHLVGFLAQSRLTDCRGPDRAVPSRAVGSCWHRGGATASRGFGPPDVSREGAGTWTCTRGLQGTPRAARHRSPSAVRSSPSPAHPPCPELAAHASSLPPTSSPNSGRWKRKRVQRCLGPGRAVASLGPLVCSTCSALLGSQPLPCATLPASSGDKRHPEPYGRSLLPSQKVRGGTTVPRCD